MPVLTRSRMFHTKRRSIMSLARPGRRCEGNEPEDLPRIILFNFNRWLSRNEPKKQ